GGSAARLTAPARVAGRKTPTRTPAPGRRLRSIPRWSGPGAASGHPGTSTAPMSSELAPVPTRARSRTAPGKATRPRTGGSPQQLEHVFYYARAGQPQPSGGLRPGRDDHAAGGPVDRPVAHPRAAGGLGADRMPGEPAQRPRPGRAVRFAAQRVLPPPAE